MPVLAYYNFIVVLPTAILLTFLALVLFAFPRRTGLRGPKRSDLLYGIRKHLLRLNDLDVAKFHQRCFEEYGAVFSLPWNLGTERVVIGDPKALQHIYARDSYGYVKNAVSQAVLENSLGRGLLWLEGDAHKRQRKALSPGFSTASIKDLEEIFLDAGHKMKQAWQHAVEANNGETILDVHDWMNRITLTIIGLAGFSHDFGLLSDAEKVASIAQKFDSLRPTNGVFFTTLLSVFAQFFPVLLKLPSGDVGMLRGVRDTLYEEARMLLEKNRREGVVGNGDGDGKRDKSIIGLLVQEEQLTTEEILAENTMLFAGYVSTAATLLWTLVELCKHPEKQTKLRQELAQSGTDPSFDQLMSTTTFPYLDAVVHEILRLHPAFTELNRVAAQDDILPLSKPITLSNSSGQQLEVSSLPIPKGTNVTFPIYALNTSEEFWGADAKEFVPERWLRELEEKDKEGGGNLKNGVGLGLGFGYRQLASFADGPRTCLGRTFAVMEIKVVISTLIRNFELELPGPKGEKTDVGIGRLIVSRPKIEGEEGLRVRLRVRCVD